ncbi:S9 family peptidase, partial [Pseudoxanthomonas sp. SGD-10]
KVPLMIFQGGKDEKVNMIETNQFVKELRKNKQKVVYILNESEPHTISNTSIKIHFYQNIEVFLNKQIFNK